MVEKQRTIKAPVSVSGVGLHTGKPVTITFQPAPENHWYKFQRIDLEGQPIIEADADLVVELIDQRGVAAEAPGHGTGDSRRVVALHAAHHHAQVLRLHHHGHAVRLEVFGE